MSTRLSNRTLKPEAAPSPPLTARTDPRAGSILLGLARQAITSRGAPEPSTRNDPAWLAEPGAAFVTLTRDGALRGCVGSVEPHRSLRDDVRRNACAAAFHDPRFPPLPATEVPLVCLEVSLLSATESLRFTSREDLLEQLRPGSDGVVLRWHGHHAAFLPQVWQQLPEPEEFLEHLLHKARLPVTFWEPGLSVRRFTVTAWREDRPSGAKGTP